MELTNEAVWDVDGDLAFWVEGADDGHLLTRSELGSENLLTVSTVRLKDYRRRSVDLLKLDIEGAETRVVLDCAGSLGQVDHLFVEYHSLIGKEQRIGGYAVCPSVR